MKRTFVFLDEKSSKFWSIEVQGESLVVNYGKTGTTGQTQTKTFASADECNRQAEKLIKEKIGKGYVEEGSNKADSAPAAAGALPVFTEGNYRELATCIATAEAAEKYGLEDVVNFPFINFAEDQGTCVVPELHVAGILGGKEGDWNAFNLIVEGDLTVDGDIDWADYGRGSFLYVGGNLKAKNLLLQGCVELHIKGNLDVENGIIGHHGDDGGFLEVGGNTSAKQIFCVSYFGMEFASRPKAILVGGDINCEADFGEDELEAILSGKLWNKENGYANDHEIAEALRTEKPVLKPGALPASAAVLKKLDKLLEKSQTVTELDLSDKKLKNLPSQIFEFPNLKTLKLEKNRITKLTSRVGELIGLEELNLQSAGLTALPPEIGKLSSLKSLNLLYNYELPGLPDEIGELENLEKLYVSGFSDLPTTLVGLKSLKILSFNDPGNFNSAHLDRLPPVIFEMPWLESLGVTSYNYTFRELPMDVVKLTALKSLSLNLRHTAKNGFPDLPQLKNLTHLDLDGYQCPDLSIIERPEIWNCTSLTSLDLGRWGDHDHRKGVENLPEDAFSRMPDLEVFDFSFSASKSMTDMPQSFYELKKLRKITFSSHKEFSKAVQEKMKKAFPNATIEF